MIQLILNEIETKTGKAPKPQGHNRWMACCPAHDDRSPSLAIQENTDGRILIHCFAGCGGGDVMQAIGLTLSDLYPDGALGDFRGWEKMKRDMEEKRNKQQREQDALTVSLAQSMKRNNQEMSLKDMKLAYEAEKRLTHADH